MSAVTTSLMSGGHLPAGAASLLGETITPSTLAGTGTAQTGATAIGGYTVVLAGAESGATAFVLPANAPLGWRVEVYSVGGATALIFPPSGGNIDGAWVLTSVGTPCGSSSAFPKSSIQAA